MLHVIAAGLTKQAVSSKQLSAAGRKNHTCQRKVCFNRAAYLMLLPDDPYRLTEIASQQHPAESGTWAPEEHPRLPEQDQT
jgi:hypothetical protein